LLLGVLPTCVIPVLDEVFAPLTGAKAVDALVPPFFASSAQHTQLPKEFAAEFHDLGAQVGQEVLPGRGLVVMHRGGEQNPVVFAMSTSYMFPVLVGLLAITCVVVRWGIARHRRVVRRPCWDGGIRRLLPEMTYTATGFSNPVRVIFDAILRPTAIEDRRETVAAHFRTAIHRRRQAVHIVDRWFIAPLTLAALQIGKGLARLHDGRINAYVAYGLITLVVVLVIALLSGVL
jgi:hydrogenase-4 component B